MVDDASDEILLLHVSSSTGLIILQDREVYLISMITPEEKW